jgi:lipoprotein-anchoring transpeptidase ErfK/SrfK
VVGLLAGRDRGDSPDRAAPAAPPPKPLKVTVVPAAGAADVRPDATVRVVVTNGRLTRVQVAAPGRAPVAGRLAAGRQSWESTGPLLPGIGYQVTWTARDEAGRQATQTTAFTTLTAKGELRAAVAPLEGETVGVGQPIVVYFNHPVRNKAEVERALHVEASREVVGAWRWFGDEQVRYRPEEYWPAHTRVRLEADLAGVDAGGGVWGVQGRGISFAIGRSHVSTVNAATHQMTVEVDGRVVRRMPVSTGRPEYATRNGVHTVQAKERVRIMDSDTVGLPGAYRVRAEYAVRLTNSGEFVHSAPWSVGAQGSANVSHGCVNLSPEHAAWFFGISQRGDVVEVVGSSRGPDDTEGMIEWNMGFDQWRQGSALRTSPGTTDLS